jgi:hypothetical protein
LETAIGAFQEFVTASPADLFLKPIQGRTGIHGQSVVIEVAGTSLAISP